MVLPLLDDNSVARGEEWKQVVETWVRIEGAAAGFSVVVNGPVSMFRFQTFHISDPT